MKLGKNQEEDISISGDRLQIGMDKYVGQGVMKGDVVISCGIRCKQRRRVMSMRNEEGSYRWIMMIRRMRIIHIIVL